MVEKLLQEVDKDIIFEKLIAEGGYGKIYEMKYKNKNKNYVAKIIEKHNSQEISGEKELTIEINGSNIIKIKKIYENKKFRNNYYDIIIMEKADLNDLSSLKDLKDNKFYLINAPFKEIFGDNILRFFSKQIIEGLEKLERSEFLHLDIKPKNILIFDNYILKLTDFSFLTKIESRKEGEWGSPGYETPEFFEKKFNELSNDDKKKQDYFALGAVLYFLKYQEQMLDYQRINEDNILNSELVIELIQRKMNQIKSSALSDVELNNFLCDLIQYKPKDRPSFENIYRNKWLNKKTDFKTVTYRSLINDEGKKLLFELNKNDFLYQHKNEISNKEKNKKFKFRL